MKYLLTGCFLALLCVAGWGQGSENCTSASCRIQLHRTAAAKLWFADPDSARVHCDSLILIGTKNDDPTTEFVGVYFLGQALIAQGKWQDFRPIFGEFSSRVDRLPMRSQLIYRLELSEFYYKLGELDSARFEINAVIKSVPAGDKGLLNIRVASQIQLGKILKQGNRYEEAIRLYNQAETDLRNLPQLPAEERNNLAVILVEKAGVYSSLGRHKLAQTTLRDIIIEFRDLPPVLQTAHINFGNESVLLEEADSVKVAIDYLAANVGQLKASSLCRYLDLQSDYHLFQKDYSKVELLNRELETCLQQHGSADQLCSYYLNEGEYYLEIGQWKSAKKSYGEAIQLMSQLQDQRLDRKAEILYGYLEASVRSSDTSLISTLSAYHDLQDSLVLEATREQVFIAKEKFETVRKERQNQQLQTQNQLATAQLQIQRSFLTASGIGLVAALAIAGLFFHQRRQQQALNTELAERNHKVDLLYKELGHRAMSNLVLAGNLLRAQLREATDADSQRLLAENEARIQAITTVQRRLGSDGAGAGYQHLLQDIAEQLTAGYARPVRTDIQLVPAELDTQQKSYLPLIVNELLTNSLKYAFTNTDEPQIQLRSEVVDEELHLTYRDNGPGKAATVQGTGLGTGLLETMIRQLDGRCAERNEDGYVFELWVPVGAG